MKNRQSTMKLTNLSSQNKIIKVKMFARNTQGNCEELENRHDTFSVSRNRGINRNKEIETFV